MVESEHGAVEQRRVFGLQQLLLGLQQVVLAGGEFHDVLQAQPELLAHEVVALLHALHVGLGIDVLLLPSLSWKEMVLSCFLFRKASFAHEATHDVA